MPPPDPPPNEPPPPPEEEKPPPPEDEEVASLYAELSEEEIEEAMDTEFGVKLDCVA